MPGLSDGGWYLSAGNPVGPRSSVIFAPFCRKLDTVSWSRSGSMSFASTSIVMARPSTGLDVVGAGNRRLVGGTGREQLHVDCCGVRVSVLVDDRVVERIGAAEAWRSARMRQTSR